MLTATEARELADLLMSAVVSSDVQRPSVGVLRARLVGAERARVDELRARRPIGWPLSVLVMVELAWRRR